MSSRSSGVINVLQSCSVNSCVIRLSSRRLCTKASRLCGESPCSSLASNATSSWTLLSACCALASSKSKNFSSWPSSLRIENMINNAILNQRFANEPCFDDLRQSHIAQEREHEE